MNSFVTLTFEPKGGQPCSVVLELFDRACPLAVKNFLHVASGVQPDGNDVPSSSSTSVAPLKHSKVIAIDMSPKSDAQTLLFGTSASNSCFGGFYAGEKSPPVPLLSSSSAGALLVSNVGPNTNASRFMIVMSCRSKDFVNEYTCFGVVREGLGGLYEMCSRCRVDTRTLAPIQSIVIADSVVAAGGGVKQKQKVGAKEIGKRRTRERDDDDDGGNSLGNRDDEESGRAAKKRRAEVVVSDNDGTAAIASAAITTAALPTPEGKSFDMFEAQQHVFQYDLRDITQTQTQRKKNRDSRRAKLRTYSKPSNPVTTSRGLSQHRKK